MKKNKNLIYILLLGAAVLGIISMKKKPKLKGKVIVPDLETITKEEFEKDPNKSEETQPDILIREVADAVKTTPEPLSTILTKAKGLFKKPIAKLKPTKAIFKPTLKPKIKMPTLVIPKIKPSKQIKKKTPKKRLKGFDDISVLY